MSGTQHVKVQFVKSGLVFTGKSALSLSVLFNVERSGAPSVQVDKSTVDFCIGYNQPATLSLHVMCNKAGSLSSLPEDSNVLFCQGCSNNAIVLVLAASSK